MLPFGLKPVTNPGSSDQSDDTELFSNQSYKEKNSDREYKNPSRYAFTSGRHDSISKGFKRKSSPFSQVLIKILQDWSHKRTDIPLGVVKERMTMTTRVLSILILTCICLQNNGSLSLSLSFERDICKIFVRVYKKK